MIDQLHPAFQRLLATSPTSHGRLPRDMPTQGVYLFSEGDRHLYAGRSNHLRNRVEQHCRAGSQHNQAVFAFRPAREATGMVTPAYSTGAGSRKNLAVDTVFAESFTAAKARVRAMDYRCIEETDQTRQALLELYCAIALSCPYNDFNTH
ncbi:hypothetical protein U1763_19630 [Sphingomonas sp. LB2R24]|uniref:hypothetical protein n=1 Tax=Sphingomonas sorbitolis TaxID=3096165 RepID=UPI002FCBEE9B